MGARQSDIVRARPPVLRSECRPLRELRVNPISDLEFNQDAPRVNRTTQMVGAAAIGASAIGATTWLMTMAAAPRYSFGGWALSGTTTPAPALGLLPRVSGASAIPVDSIASDNDGLWVLIVPILLVFTFVLVGVAAVGAWVQGRIVGGSSQAH